MNILLMTENPSDATSFYRGVAPLIELKREYTNIHFDNCDPSSGELQWSTLLHYDLLILQRPASTYALDLATKALQCGLKLIIDYDDDLLDVPWWNPNSAYYNDDKNKKIIHSLIRLKSSMPDQVAMTVSTPYLAQSMTGAGAQKVVVVPNALNIRVMGEPYYAHAPSVDVAWRGSNTHSRDLLTWQGSIHAAFDKVEYIGYLPDIARANDTHIKPTNILTYYARVLKMRNRKMMFVVLEDNPFNRSKSNIAYIEAVWAGMTVMAPDWEEWRLPGVFNYNDHETFLSQSRRILSMSESDRFDNWTAAARHITQNMNLQQANKIRYELIKSMVK